MIFAKQPTDQGHEELERMARWEDRRVRQRARMVLLSLRRIKTAEIADRLGVRSATVRLWLHRFNVHGSDGLYDRPRSGRPRRAVPTANHTACQSVPKRCLEESYSSRTVAKVAF
jgi:transposase